MAITAQAGVFSFGPQSAKGVLATDFYKHRGSDIDLATVSDDRLGPPEVGGVPTPSIPYRAGLMATGGALLNPRLENTLGWLLYGTLGAVTTTADEDVLGNTVTTMYAHEFKFASDAGYVPWMSFRKWIPGVNAAAQFGEQYRDCKIVALTLALPNDGLVNARVDVLGMAMGQNFFENPSWTYANTQYEDWESLPIGCVTGGYLKVPGLSASALPVTQATITFQNAPLDIRMEKVFGSPYLEDVTVVGRQMTVDMVLKWQDPNLYQAILTGSTTGTQWTAAPFTSDLDVYTLSSKLAGGVAPDSPYGLRVLAEEVMYQVVGGIRLAGGQSVMLRVTGTALPGANYYSKILLGNKATQYSWPAADIVLPDFSAAEIGNEDDNTIVITFTEAIQLEVGTNWMLGFSVEVDAAPYTIVHGYQYASNKIALVLATTVTTGEVVTVSYDSATGYVEDLYGNDLADEIDFSVTNNT